MSSMQRQTRNNDRQDISSYGNLRCAQPSFLNDNKRRNYGGDVSFANDNNRSVKDLYTEVVYFKKQLEIKTTHQEKLKKITKNASELKQIDSKLHELRQNFLNFSVDHF
ncbi:hypothetical protein Gyru_ORF47 [Gynaephora ruoergensis nucleopolyhedrovirus]|nr:hypothetical protein Gyru_ORF47 [Gynaephora ruoergensis nucleopolyhedrovirus]